MKSRLWPSIDHGILSPSGHVSKRSEKLAKARIYALLFPDGFPAPQAPAQLDEAVVLRQQAAQLRDLADRGMSPRKHRVAADRLEARAAQLEAEQL